MTRIIAVPSRLSPRPIHVPVPYPRPCVEVTAVRPHLYDQDRDDIDWCWPRGIPRLDLCDTAARARVLRNRRNHQ